MKGELLFINPNFIQMNTFLSQKIKAKIKAEDVFLSDFKELDENTGLENLNFQKARGSVRLLLRKVFTPKDAKNLKKKVLSLDFEK